jgi:hypothetical protein
MLEVRTMILRFFLASILAAAAFCATAQEFRAINPIRAPRAQLPAGAQRVVPQKPVPREKVEAAVAKVTAAWNTPELERVLAQDFYDRTRLLDNLASKAPRDARLRVVGIQGVQLLDQYIRPATAQNPYRAMVSQLSVTVRTQIEFNDATGFQRLDGTNEFIIDLTEPAL